MGLLTWWKQPSDFAFQGLSVDFLELAVDRFKLESAPSALKIVLQVFYLKPRS